MLLALLLLLCTNVLGHTVMVGGYIDYSSNRQNTKNLLPDHFFDYLAKEEEPIRPRQMNYDYNHPQSQQEFNGLTPLKSQSQKQSTLDQFTNFFTQPSMFFGSGKKKRRRRKKKHFKKFKYFVPLLITAIAKLAHFIPIVKLTLVALFALVLFAKKAFLVSVGSLLLVLYDNVHKNGGMAGFLKDRNQASKLSIDKLEDEENYGWWGLIDKNHTGKTKH